METKVKELLEDATTIVVSDIAIPNIFPLVTYYFYSENGTLFGSGTATEEGSSCQVDIWYKVKTEAVKNGIKAIKQTIINERYFSFPKIESTYETVTKIHHTYINFELIKESEV